MEQPSGAAAGVPGPVAEWLGGRTNASFDVWMPAGSPERNSREQGAAPACSGRLFPQQIAPTPSIRCLAVAVGAGVA